MLDHHPFGAARRAGGVDDVTEIARTDGDLVVAQPPRTAGLNRPAVGVEPHDRTGEGGVGLREAGVRHEGASPGVPQDVGDSVSGVRGIDRHVSGAGLQYSEQGRVGVGRAGKEMTDDRPSPDAAPAQMAGQAIGAGLELGVGHALVIGDDGDVVRPRVGLGLEERVQDQRVRLGTGRHVRRRSVLGDIRSGVLRSR